MNDLSLYTDPQMGDLSPEAEACSEHGGVGGPGPSGLSASPSVHATYIRVGFCLVK